jgi:hypothetical protein
MYAMIVSLKQEPHSEDCNYDKMYDLGTATRGG